MAVSWTDDQKKAIETQNKNILVSAAAGSGKTAVLVERIIRMITAQDNPVDIDRLAVVTFTKAAAAQMKDKIRDRLDMLLSNEPDNLLLTRQLTMLGNAQITTIDSFCMWIIKNHFTEVALDPGFKVADDGELKLIENDIMDEMLEQMYEEGDRDFLAFVDSYGRGYSDSNVSRIIYDVYEFARSNPWPDEWYEECLKMYEGDIENNYAIKMLENDIREALSDYLQLYVGLIEVCQSPNGPFAYAEAIQSDYLNIQSMLSTHNLRELCNRFTNLEFESLKRTKMDCDEEIKQYVKFQRELFKGFVNRIKEKIFIKDFDLLIDDLRANSTSISTIIGLSKEFSKRVAKEKRDRGIIDFNDLEHFALDILIKRENGKIIYTDVADKLKGYFVEILIDEYQDSNYLQEVILNAVSHFRDENMHNNIYMVGDVKQSIYRFRLACPDLFISKYNDYFGNKDDRTRIELQKNFRSRKNILDCTNDIFSRVMNKKFCGIDYSESHRLNLGADYPESNDDSSVNKDGESADRAGKHGNKDGESADKAGTHGNKDSGFSGVAGSFTGEEGSTEVLLIDKADYEEDYENLSSKEAEASVVADRIKEMMNGKAKVYDSDTQSYRPLKYKDIVILLRSVSNNADIFVNKLMDEGIPAVCDVSAGYFNVREIRVVLSMLTIIDNPKQEIYLASAMLSYFGGFTDEDIANIRILGKENAENLYMQLEYVAQMKEKDDKSMLVSKCVTFLERLNHFRDRSTYSTIFDLAWELIYTTGYYDYVSTMPSGMKRQANLDVLIEKAASFENTTYSGLFNFLRYIEKMQKFEVDFSEGNILSDSENVVRVMSIHKSKGLEFPVVFISGLHKKINLQDIRREIIIDQNLGIGTNLYNLENRTKTPTLIRGAISRKLVRESIAEEERILYVAMTRAKEKMIMTAVINDYEKTVDKSRMQAIGFKNGGFSYAQNENFKSFLDMVLPVCTLDASFNEGKFMLKMATVDYERKSDLNTGLINRTETADLFSTLPEYVVDENASKKLKITVTQLKQMQHDADYEENAFMHEELVRAQAKAAMEEYADAKTGKTVNERNGMESRTTAEEYADIIARSSVIPRFISGKADKLASNERGTAYHRVMECLNYAEALSLKGAKDEIDNMIACDKISRLQADSVNPSDIYTFVNAPIGKRVAKAENIGKVRREQPFVYEYEGQLVQGVIDLYFEEDNELVVVDYKTDRVDKSEKGEEELIKRYKIQLDYYADALMKLTGLNVKEKYIYSFVLGKEISVM